MPGDVLRERRVEREVQARLRRLERSIGNDLERLRIDAGASKAAIAREAGVDRTFYGRIETASAHASLESLVAVAIAMGADLSIRLYPGRGPRLTDRHSARMIETILGSLAPMWVPHPEVYVTRPIRGFIDVALERRDQRLLVVAEFESMLPRLEQQIRWASEKAAAIASSDLVGPGPAPQISRLLVLRSTESTRSIARKFEATLRAAFPARSREAVESLRTGSPWPGNAIIWIRIDGDRVELLDGPPRGVALGR
jgi:transcriptional regulator with XRE-family HTH domain